MGNKINGIYYSPIIRNGGLAGGLSDRLKGIAFVFALCLIKKRKFYIYWPDWNKQMWLIPNFSDLLLGEGVSLSDAINIDIIDYMFGKRKIDAFCLLEKKLDNTCYIINANTLAFDELSKYKIFLSEALDLTEWSEHCFFHTIFNLLFTVSDEIVNSPIAKKIKEKKQKDIPVIGLELRCGGWGGWRDPVIDHPEVAKYSDEIISSFTKSKKLMQPSVYFSSDSIAAKSYAYETLSNKYCLFMLNSLPIHFERSLEIDIEDYRQIHENQYCLSLCDYIIMGNGGFGVIGSYRAGIKPYRYWEYFSKPYFLRFTEGIARLYGKATSLLFIVNKRLKKLLVVIRHSD